MTETEKKKTISGPPVVQRANALLDRVRMLGGDFSRSRYGLDRPFDSTAAGPTIGHDATIGHDVDLEGETLTGH
jgi:acetyltransferase-like isoleucine patch superfamily enzyme